MDGMVLVDTVALADLLTRAISFIYIYIERCNLFTEERRIRRDVINNQRVKATLADS